MNRDKGLFIAGNNLKSNIQGTPFPKISSL